MRDRAPETPLLSVRGLTIVRPGSKGPVTLVNRLDLTVEAGSTLGLVGESGSGKSLTLRAIIGLLPRGLSVAAGVIEIDGSRLPLTANRSAPLTPEKPSASGAFQFSILVEIGLLPRKSQPSAHPPSH